MADIIKISELPALTSGAASANDVLPLTNNEDNTTYKISLDSIDYYIKYSTDSRKFISGSSELATMATSSFTASYLNYTGGNTGTASYALKCLTSSYALTSSNTISSSYAATASYISNISYVEIETASFSKTASFLTYNPIRSNGTASFAISSSIARSASYASGSNIFALSASYGLSSSYSLTSSYTLSSSNALTASYAFSASTSINSISTSYISDNLLYSRLSRKYTFANPVASISSGSYQYVFGWNRHPSPNPSHNETGTQIYKLNTDNSNIQHICDLNSLWWTSANLSLVSSSYSGKIYYAWNIGVLDDDLGTLGATYRVLANSFISSSITEYKDNESKGLYWKQVIVDIDDTNFEYPTFYGLDSDYDGVITLNSIELYKFAPSSGDPTNRKNYVKTLVGGAGGQLDLVNNTFNNSTEFKKFEPVNTYILYCFFNPKNKRIYLVTTGTGLMHIFNIQAYFTIVGENKHFADWWVLPSTRYTYLTYEKTISIVDNEGPYSTDNADHYSLEYDLITGKELYINFGRRGNSKTLGTVYKVPWVE